MKKTGGILWPASITTTFFIIVIYWMVIAETLTLAEETQISCMHELRFCLGFLNNSDDDPPPPDEHCCQPLDYIFKSVPECVCNLMGLLGMEQAGINVSRALTLPDRCSQRSTALHCTQGTSDKTPLKNKAESFVVSKLWDSSLRLTIALEASSSIILTLQTLYK